MYVGACDSERAVVTGLNAGRHWSRVGSKPASWRSLSRAAPIAEHCGRLARCRDEFGRPERNLAQCGR
jgi:hypothetical protein